MRDKTIVIFSTRYILPYQTGEKETLLFGGNTDRLESTPYTKLERSKLNFFFEGDLSEERQQIYRIADEYVFAHESLSEEFLRKRKKGISVEFISSLFHDVLTLIKQRDKKVKWEEIRKIKFILHRKEILGNENVPYRYKKSPELLSHLEIIATSLDIPLNLVETDEAADIGKNQTQVSFCGFSHGAYTEIVELLTKFPWKNLPETSISAHIDEVTDNMALRVLKKEEDLLLQQEYNLKDVKILSKFNFKFGELQYDENSRYKAGIEGKPENFISFKKLYSNFPDSTESDTQEDKKLVHILFCRSTDIRNSAVLDHIVESKFEEGKIDLDECVPTIVVSTLDVMWDWENVMDNLQGSINEKAEYLKKLNLDLRFRFLDSSIWFRYVSLEEISVDANKGPYGIVQQLGEVLQEIDRAYEHELYQKNVSLEYFELHLRLARQSYLEPFGVGHASNVVPFSFHSESFMKRKADQKIADFLAEGLQWNFLLIDDFANVPLRDYKDTLEGNKQTTKSSIIWPLINQSNPVIETEEKQEKKISRKEDYVESLDEAMSILDGSVEIHKHGKENEPQGYDVILLDYLFSVNAEGIDKNARYGTEFIQNIVSRIDEFYLGRGPYGAFWIFPITVFPDAFASAMQEKGIQQFETGHFIARGADPINTPHLFRSNLYAFLDIQVKMARFELIDVFSFLLEYPISEFQEDKNGLNFIDAQRWARISFGSFLRKFSAHESLKDDSRFGKLMLNKLGIDKKDPNPVEHLGVSAKMRDLMYNLGFMSGYMVSKEAVIRNYRVLRGQLIMNENIFPADTYKRIFKEFDELGHGILTQKAQYLD